MKYRQNRRKETQPLRDSEPVAELGESHLDRCVLRGLRCGSFHPAFVFPSPLTQLEQELCKYF